MFQHPDIEVLEHKTAHFEKRVPLWIPILCGILWLTLWVGGFMTMHLWVSRAGNNVFAAWLIALLLSFCATLLTCPTHSPEYWKIRIRGSSVREVLMQLQNQYDTEACAIDIWKCTRKE